MRKPSDELIKRVMRAMKEGEFTTSEKSTVLEALGGHAPPEWILHGPLGVTNRPKPATSVVKDLVAVAVEAVSRGGYELARGARIRPEDLHKHFSVSLVEFGSVRLVEEISAGISDPLDLVLVLDTVNDDVPKLYGPRKIAKHVTVTTLDAGDQDPCTGDAIAAETLKKGVNATWPDHVEIDA